MKLSKTLWYVSFIVTAVFLMPVLAVTPLGQIDSFDNIVGTGWTEPRGTGLMEQDNTTYKEGTGSIRVKFEDRDPCEWDVDLERVISLNLDYNVPVALTFWVDTNVPEPRIPPLTDECVRELKVFQGTNIAHFAVPTKNTGWRKIKAVTSAFTLDPNNVTDFNWAAIDKIQFFCSTWDTPGGSVWIDDLRLELVPSKNPPYQVASYDDIAAEGWFDDRFSGLMRQSVIEVNEVNEGDGSMRIAFTEVGYSGGIPDFYDVEPKIFLVPALDVNDYNNWAVTLWVWSDLVNDSKLHEVILYDVNNNSGRGRFPPLAGPGWNKVVVNLDEFIWTDRWNAGIPPENANWAKITAIGLWTSCYEDPGNDIYLDDLRIEPAGEAISEATIVNADRTFGTITVDGNAADWAALVDSDVVDFDLAAVPEPNGNLHVKYRLAWDPNYLYILVQEQNKPGTGDLLAKEANEVGYYMKKWSLNDGLGGDAYYDALTLYFDFTNNRMPGTDIGISLWLFLGLNSKGLHTPGLVPMMAWTNGRWGGHWAEAIANGSMWTKGTLGSRVIEASIKWSDLDIAIDDWRLPEGGLAAAVKPGYIFGCDPRLDDFEQSSAWFPPPPGGPTVERNTAWLNGKMWDWQGTPTGRDSYSTDVRLVCSAGDLDFDCHVDFVDYAQFAEKWLDDGCNNINGFCNGADIVINGEVNMEDLAKFTQRWLD